MIFTWLKRRRRRALLATAPGPGWARHLAAVGFWPRLDPDEQTRLLAIARIIDAEKQWLGGGGLTVTEAMRVSVSAQAALLLLNLPHDYYHNVQTIVIHPDRYILPRAPAGDLPVAPQATPVLGHATHHGGPVVLSWRHAHHGGQNPSDGRNLVFHEFAHKLDMKDGVVDGTMPLRCRAQGRRWFTIMSREYQALRRQAARGKRAFLDLYGATNVAEFFAVATEHFFEQPTTMRRRHPELYAVLAEGFGQDPAAWSSRPPACPPGPRPG